MHNIPLSLYIHIPWCIQKCPYCDFNSHKSPDMLPEEAYVQSLLSDLSEQLIIAPPRPIHSIFIGGGTPSLLSEQAYALLFEGLRERLVFSPNMEITLEANPGTVDETRFKGYFDLGINRLSLGIQSFNPKHLKKLGRIHDEVQAKRAIEAAYSAGFTKINLDLMHSLPNQTVQEGLADLKTALSFHASHLSWYQLTIEPNTVFYKQKPPLMREDDVIELETLGFELLKQGGLQRYEISAFSTPGDESAHNLNYWLFGDYYGIGAGAHGKYTDQQFNVYRNHQVRQPKDYLNPDKAFAASRQKISSQDIIFEFMLNATRLEMPIAHDLFLERTGLPFEKLHPFLAIAAQKGLVTLTQTHWQVTALGRLFTNDLQGIFLN